MLSVIKGIEPLDQIEAMLGAQMAAVHMASMTFARRLAHVDTMHATRQRLERLQQADAHLRRPDGSPQALPLRWRAEDDRSACSRGRGRPGDRRQRQCSGRGGRGPQKNQRFNPMLLHMHQALRCHARSKRSGLQLPSASG